MVAKKCQTSSAAKIIFRVMKYSENKLLFKILCFFKRHNLEYANILSLSVIKPNSKIYQCIELSLIIMQNVLPTDTKYH